MKELDHGWKADVDRGPNWLLVRLHSPGDGAAAEAGLADDLLLLLKNHLMRRMVLELNDVQRLRSGLLGQLVRLHDSVCNEGGVLRICGLSDENRQVLQACRLDRRLPSYVDRREAVMGAALRLDKSHANVAAASLE